MLDLTVFSMPIIMNIENKIELLQADITKIIADAIVNAANTSAAAVLMARSTARVALKFWKNAVK
jgi:uncharacterized small protein (DUF1192 family)